MKDTARFYDIPGVGSLPSVTTILQVISKPALYNWQAKQGTHKAKIIMNKLERMSPLLHDSMLGELGPEFFLDGNAQAQQAADYGTQAHGVIEQILKGPAIPSDLLRMKDEPVRNAVNAFLKWMEGTRLKLIKAESMVYSKTFGFAGTADAIAEVSGKLTLLDWKTSKAIYPEYKLQTVAYKYAAEGMAGEIIPSVMICRFGKDGSFETYEVPAAQHPQLFDTFMDAKRLWEWQRRETEMMAA